MLDDELHSVLNKLNNGHLTDEEIELYITNSFPIVRRIAFSKLSNKTNFVESFVYDPDHRCREMAVDYICDISLLKYLLKDDNDNVRIMVLKHLQSLENTEVEFNEDFLSELLDLINDCNKNVRIEFAKLLAKFENLETSFIRRLFDKNDLGLFIYGSEDECKEVRMYIIRSITNFLTPETIGFLIDMLNEDTEMVREIISEKLKDCTTMRKYKCKKNQLKYVLGSLKENNRVVQENILKTLSNFVYADPSVFFFIFFESSIPEMFKYRYLPKIVENNSVLFKEYVEKNIYYSLDNKHSLVNEKYLSELLLLNTLKMHNVSNKVSNDMEYISYKRLLYSSDDSFIRKRYSKYIADLISNKIVNEDLVFNKDFLMKTIDYSNEGIGYCFVKDVAFDAFEHFLYIIDNSDKGKPIYSFKITFQHVINLFYQDYEKSILDIKRKQYMVIGSFENNPVNNHQMVLKFNCMFDVDSIFIVYLKLSDDSKEILIKASEIMEFPFLTTSKYVEYKLVTFSRSKSMENEIFLTTKQILKLN